jgi:hypothetical protein
MWRYIAEDRTLHNHRYNNLKFFFLPHESHLLNIELKEAITYILQLRDNNHLQSNICWGLLFRWMWVSFWHSYWTSVCIDWNSSRRCFVYYWYKILKHLFTGRNRNSACCQIFWAHLLILFALVFNLLPEIKRKMVYN